MEEGEISWGQVLKRWKACGSAHARPHLESTSYLLDDQAFFSGDTLFLAGVGRPDLEASPAEARQWAFLLYRSLQQLLTLSPETLILPGHIKRTGCL